MAETEEITVTQSPVDLLIKNLLDEELTPFSDNILKAQNNLATAMESFALESELLRQQRDELNNEIQRLSEEESIEKNAELIAQNQAALAEKDKEIATINQRLVDPVQQELATANEVFAQEQQRLLERVNGDGKAAFKEYLEERIEQLPEEKQEAARKELAAIIVEAKSLEEMKQAINREGSTLNQFTAQEVETGTSTSIVRIHVSQEGDILTATIKRADGTQEIQLKDGEALDLSALNGRAVQVTADKDVDGKVNLVGTEDVDLRFRGPGSLTSKSEIGRDGEATTTVSVSEYSDRYANPRDVFQVSESDKNNFAGLQLRSEMAETREQVLVSREILREQDALAMNEAELTKANEQIAQLAASQKDRNPGLAAALAQALGERDVLTKNGLTGSDQHLVTGELPTNLGGNNLEGMDKSPSRGDASLAV